MKLKFLGATGTVTDSKYLIEVGEPVNADAMRPLIKETLHWNTCLPGYLKTVELN
jgi:hypothetical protein